MKRGAAMPAVARKVTPDSYQSHQSASTLSAAPPARTRRESSAARNRRWQEDSAHRPPAKARRRTSAPQPAAQPQEDWRGLVDHFNSQQAQQQEHERVDLDARRLQRRRERLRHRPFRLTFLTIALLGAPLLLLGCLLNMNSNSLALARQDASLQNQIIATRFELQNTQKEIAGLNSSPHLEHWARVRGWQQAGPQDFDDVSSVVTTSGNLVEPSREAP
jgi:cell division protein FtsL